MSIRSFKVEPVTTKPLIPLYFFLILEFCFALYKLQGHRDTMLDVYTLDIATV